MTRRVDIHIETLVLNPLPPAGRRRAAAALRVELARRIVSEGLPTRLVDGSHWDLVVARDPVELGKNASPEAAGKIIAGGVRQALGGGDS